MNHVHRWHLLVLGLLWLGSGSLAQADTAEAILRDFEDQSKREISDLNRTLEKAAAPVLAQHISAGKTREAEELSDQVRKKLAGEAVAPSPQLATLFSRYDAALGQKLNPLRATAIRRIDSLLRGSDGKNLETLSALARLRAQIETRDSATTAHKAAVWTYHSTSTSTTIMAEIRLLPNGIFEMSTLSEKGRWKANARGDRIDIDIRDQRWRMEIAGDTATLQRPDIGMRWLRKKTH